MGVITDFAQKADADTSGTDPSICPMCGGPRKIGGVEVGEQKQDIAKKQGFPMTPPNPVPAPAPRRMGINGAKVTPTTPYQGTLPPPLAGDRG
jgi:hypothetical protein